jgi:hypothetical protein
MRVAGVVLVLLVVLGVASAAAQAPPAFRSSVSAVTWDDLRWSYRAGCPVAPAQLRTVRVSHWGFDGEVHEGALVVHRRAAPALVKVFRQLHAARFPIRRLEPVSRYRGSDRAAMAADNTSAFNCRRVNSAATGAWSMHAYGLAIDVNPVENPYVWSGGVSPPAGRAHLDRTRYRPGYAVEGGVLVRAFASVGWQWGGRWGSAKDYQHFSENGR